MPPRDIKVSRWSDVLNDNALGTMLPLPDSSIPSLTCASGWTNSPVEFPSTIPSRFIEFPGLARWDQLSASPLFFLSFFDNFSKVFLTFVCVVLWNGILRISFEC